MASAMESSEKEEKIERRKSVASTKESPDSIRVICRFRPPKAIEIEMHGQSGKLDNFVIDEERGTVSAEIDFERKNFTFDKVFGINCAQVEVFDAVASTIDSVMVGFNGTILAYGQTSSGKTHTMEGPSLWDTTTQGVIPRTIDKLFQAISEADVHTSFTVSVSYYEVYCERIRDLLNPTSDNLKMREVKQEGFIIQDVTEVFCVDRDSIIRIIETGKAHRASAPTLMNAESSRSHSILSILVTQKLESTGRHRKGKIYLVDLAGSEKVSKTGAKGTRLEEAKNINRSLTTLGMVINALCDGASHVPYRDSKLSRILQDSLGGNSKTTLIICCASEDRHISETISTLRFGERAKKIKNNAKVNEELGIPELKKLLAAAQREILTLKNQIAIPSPQFGIGNTVGDDEGDNQSRSSVVDEDDQEDTPGAQLSIRIAELEELLENQRLSTLAEQNRCIIIEGELKALKHTVVELEAKLLQVQFQQLPSNLCVQANLNTKSQNGNSGMKYELNGDGLKDGKEDRVEDYPIKERLSSTDLILQFGDIESLRQESMNLRDLFIGEIQAMENIVATKQEETKNARATASDMLQRYGSLRQEHESQVQRLMMKLSQEQLARTELEDRLEQTLQRLWSNQQTEGDKGASGFFSKIFNGAQTTDAKASRASYIKKERELCREIEKQAGRIAQLNAAMESNKEAQRIVLETKESVLRSLLKQNASLSQERDTLAQRVEELTTTVEKLTELLRSVQNRTLSGVLGEETGNGASAVIVKSSVIIGGGHSASRSNIEGARGNTVMGGGKLS